MFGFIVIDKKACLDESRDSSLTLICCYIGAPKEKVSVGAFGFKGDIDFKDRDGSRVLSEFETGPSAGQQRGREF